MSEAPEPLATQLRLLFSGCRPDEITKAIKAAVPDACAEAVMFKLIEMFPHSASVVAWHETEKRKQINGRR